MEGCSKTSAVTVAALPDDILVEILSRVPAMSVCRFKCVSKACRDLIAHPDHRKKLPQAMQGLFFMTLEMSHFRFNLMDLTARPVPLDIDPAFSFLTELPGNHNLKLLHSCNGLLLFGHTREPPYYEEASGYIVCNPTTKQWQAVPYCGSPRGVNHAYLAFDPAVSSHFHLLQLQQTGMYLELMSVHAYSSETRTWSHHDQIEEEKKQGKSEGCWNRVRHLSMDNCCAFVNGFLHLVVWTWGSNKRQIVVVDVQGRARRMIRLPDVLAADWGRRKYVYFGKSQGYLHCITKELSNDRLYIWVLQDYDAQEWLLKDTVSSLQLFGGKRHKHVVLNSEVADMHLDCNVVFFFSPCEHKFIAYDMDRKKVSVFPTSKCIFRLIVGHYVPCFS